MQSYRPGHHIHWIQANRAGRRPWGWRAGVVRSYDDLAAVIDYVGEAGSITVWHFRDLVLTPGTPVRIHEELQVLEVGRAWFSYELRDGGLGAVPEPKHPDLWAPEADLPITDLAAGIAYPSTCPELAKWDGEHNAPDQRRLPRLRRAAGPALPQYLGISGGRLPPGPHGRRRPRLDGSPKRKETLMERGNGVEVVYVDDVHDPVDAEELGLDPDEAPPTVLARTDWDSGPGGGGSPGNDDSGVCLLLRTGEGYVVVQESGGEAIVDDLEADSDEAAVRRFADGAGPGETVTVYRNSLI